jgi:hypothetical protein
MGLPTLPRTPVRPATGAFDLMAVTGSRISPRLLAHAAPRPYHGEEPEPRLANHPPGRARMPGAKIEGAR